MSAPLRPQIRNSLKNLVEIHEGHHVSVDVLRAIQEEANLMKETQELFDMIDSDPFEQFDDVPAKYIDRLKRLMTVTECERVRMGGDCARIHAVVSMPTIHNLQLTFLYERKPRKGAKGCHVCYTIDLSHNFGQRERLLEVQIWSPTNAPSPEPAICIADAFMAENDEDGWEDIDSDEEVEEEKKEDGSGGSDVTRDADGQQASKKPKLDGSSEKETPSGPGSEESSGPQSTMEKEEEESDQDKYVAFLDGEVLGTFLESMSMQPLTDGTALFLLMTFPYYEHEWDLIGFVLDQAFGRESDDVCDDEDQ